MLTEQERHSLSEALARYADAGPSPTGARRSAAIEALMLLQRHRGWISDAAVQDLGELLGTSPEELEALVTFYTRLFRRPLGRHVIWYCDSASCWLMGCDRLCAALQERLGVAPGETTADGRFTLLPTVCLGACDRAPVLAVDDELHAAPQMDDLASVLDGYD